ncbi:hypothetical protein [Rufibacter sp. XAAS-G3-1]|uniref:hypothetical protein n=1 Tax=Rufibacter sp. XAAS-G3-1 TaxID=2729134 RepID=UPI001C62D293|nr:hypothetical protein [Rufibacter sp. XAAS-G3-1]
MQQNSNSNASSSAGQEGSGINMTHETQINELIGKMTQEAKVNMIHGVSSFSSGGVPRLGVPEMVMSDGPQAVRPRLVAGQCRQ